MATMKKLGKYEIIEELGRGGYGTVYRVRETALNVERALKVLHPNLVNTPEFIERFRREAQHAARLEHQHIVQVYELGEEAGYHYLVMKYMTGGSLKDLLTQGGALSYAHVLEIMDGLIKALGFAHSQPEKLVHRDIKPANILFEDNGNMRLGDFGFAKALEDSGDASLSTTGAMIGTPAYMAPELWEGQSASPASDQYALACVLVEMLSGKALFSGPTPAIMKAHLMESPALPDKNPEGSPANFGEILTRALGKDPQKRFADLSELLVALQSREAVDRIKKAPRTKKQTDPVEKKIKLAQGVSMTFVCVSAGPFLMGSHPHDKRASDDEKPQHELYLDEFWIGKAPVTNQQYRIFVKASGIKPPRGWQDLQYPEGKRDHPVVNLNWDDARRFCEWASLVSGERIHLPSEAQWEKAARGTDARIYPWGDTKPTGNICNYNRLLGTTSEVGNYSPQGDSPYGCVDMAGNIWEWTGSLFKPYPYKADDEREDQTQPRNDRVLRGGSWSINSINLRSSYRGWYYSAYVYVNFGFRCAGDFSS